MWWIWHFNICNYSLIIELKLRDTWDRLKFNIIEITLYLLISRKRQGLKMESLYKNKISLQGWIVIYKSWESMLSEICVEFAACIWIYAYILIYICTLGFSVVIINGIRMENLTFNIYHFREIFLLYTNECYDSASLFL